MALENNKSVFTTNIINTVDLAKDYLFNLVFEYEAGSVLSNIIGTDDFIIRAKTASIPSKEFTELTTEYMGSKLVYPGKATVANTFDVTFDEFQDMYISKALHRWQNLMFHQGFQNDIDAEGIMGGAIGNKLTDYCATVRLELWHSDLRTKLPVEYKFYYVWPKTVQQAQLGAENSNKLQRTCSFQFSTFEMIPST